MELRRYYKKGIDYDYYVSDEFLNELRDKGLSEFDIDNIDNADEEIILTYEEQLSWMGNIMISILDNPTYFLDQLPYLKEFNVSWNNYGTKYWSFHCRKCGDEIKYNSVKDKDNVVCLECGYEPMKLVHYGVGYPKN